MTFQLLTAHNKVALVCPGSASPTEQYAIDAQQYLGEKYQLDSIYQNDTFNMMPAKDRASIFLDYLLSDDIRAIFCLRGGEGAADIIPYLHQHQEDIKKLKPKPIIGFSDITALLIYFSQMYAWPVIHGPGLTRIIANEVDPQSENQLFDLLFGKRNEVYLSSIKPMNQLACDAKKIKATVIGGTLSLINISIKDIWEINTNNQIVIIEDVNEKSHAILRSLKYLNRIGMFDKTAAMILGNFKGAKIGNSEVEIEKNNQQIDEVLARFSTHCNFPVFQTNQFGHGKINHPVVFSTPAILDANLQKLIISI